jgi:HEAT repeat protein
VLLLAVCGGILSNMPHPPDSKNGDSASPADKSQDSRSSDRSSDKGGKPVDPAQAELREADALYELGKKAEAVARYKARFPASTDPARLIRRIVEYEAGKGDNPEAKRWIERAIDAKLDVVFEGETSRALLGEVRADREARFAAKREEELEALIHELAEGTAASRKTAARALAESGPTARRALPALTEALGSPDKELRLEALGAIVKVSAGTRDSVPALRQALKNSETDVRLQAARYAQGLGPDAAEAVPELVAALGDQGVRAEAVQAIKRIGKPAVPFLKEALGNRDPTVRLGAVRAVGSLGGDAVELVPSLVPLLREEALRRDLLRAFEKLGKAAVPALIAELKSKDSVVREVASQALGWIGPDAGLAIAPLQRLVEDDFSSDVRDAARLALRRIQPKR